MTAILERETVDERAPVEPMYTVPEASKFLKLSRSKLYGDMEAGRLTYRRFGRSRRLSQGDLRRYVEQSRVGGDSTDA